MQRKTSGTRRKENSSPKSCNLLFPAGVPRFRRRAKGEFFAIILQTSPSCRRATFPAPGKGEFFFKNPAIFSFLPQRHASRTGQKENSSSKSCNLLFRALHIPGAGRKENICQESPVLPPPSLPFSLPLPEKENSLHRSLKISSSQLAFQSSASGKKENSSPTSCNLLLRSRFTFPAAGRKENICQEFPVLPSQLAFHPSDSGKKRILAKNFKSSSSQSHFRPGPPAAGCKI